jgi:hypothetical protein
MAKYKASGKETGQMEFVVVDYRRQLLPGTFELAVRGLPKERSEGVLNAIAEPENRRRRFRAALRGKQKSFIHHSKKRQEPF